MRHLKGFTIFSILVVTFPARAQVFRLTDCLPVPMSAYIAMLEQEYPNGISIKDVYHYDFFTLKNHFACNMPPATQNQTTTDSFKSTVRAQVTMSGITFTMIAPAKVKVKVTRTSATGSNPSVFSTRMTKLNIQGGNLPPNVRIRVDPNRPSLGQTTITQLYGQFQIDSYFDIFTQISLDNGSTWVSSISSGHVVVGPPTPSTAYIVAVAPYLNNTVPAALSTGISVNGLITGYTFNNNGSAVGYAASPAIGSANSIFAGVDLFNGGTMTNYGVDKASDQYIWGTAVNSSGAVVGFATNSNGTNVGIIAPNSTSNSEIINPFGTGSSYLSGVSDSGTYAGFALQGNGNFGAIYQTVLNPAAIPLATLPNAIASQTGKVSSENSVGTNPRAAGLSVDASGQETGVIYDLVGNGVTNIGVAPGGTFAAFYGIDRYSYLLCGVADGGSDGVGVPQAASWELNNVWTLYPDTGVAQGFPGNDVAWSITFDALNEARIVGQGVGQIAGYDQGSYAAIEWINPNPFSGGSPTSFVDLNAVTGLADGTPVENKLYLAGFDTTGLGLGGADINIAGQITCTAYINDGVDSAYYQPVLLQPVGPTSVVCPSTVKIGSKSASTLTVTLNAPAPTDMVIGLSTFFNGQPIDVVFGPLFITKGATSGTAHFIVDAGQPNEEVQVVAYASGLAASSQFRTQ